MAVHPILGFCSFSRLSIQMPFWTILPAAAQEALPVQMKKWNTHVDIAGAGIKFKPSSFICGLTNTFGYPSVAARNMDYEGDQ
jgi:hypothetical protein